jgi:hypothetical protein
LYDEAKEMFRRVHGLVILGSRPMHSFIACMNQIRILFRTITKQLLFDSLGHNAPEAPNTRTLNSTSHILKTHLAPVQNSPR